MATRSREIDRGWLRIKRNLSKTPNVSVKVGIQGDDALDERDSGITNVELAATHEFGSDDDRVPQRSFIRSTFDENRKRYQAEWDAIWSTVFDSAKFRGEARLFGEGVRADMIDKIRSNIPPPLAQSTIDRKFGETTALIDSGQLLGSISVELSEERR